eukprot:Pgem_evm1s7764
MGSFNNIEIVTINFILIVIFLNLGRLCSAKTIRLLNDIEERELSVDDKNNLILTFDVGKQWYHEESKLFYYEGGKKSCLTLFYDENYKETKNEKFSLSVTDCQDKNTNEFSKFFFQHQYHICSNVNSNVYIKNGHLCVYYNITNESFGMKNIRNFDDPLLSMLWTPIQNSVPEFDMTIEDDTDDEKSLNNKNYKNMPHFNDMTSNEIKRKQTKDIVSVLGALVLYKVGEHLYECVKDYCSNFLRTDSAESTTSHIESTADIMVITTSSPTAYTTLVIAAMTANDSPTETAPTETATPVTAPAASSLLMEEINVNNKNSKNITNNNKDNDNNNNNTVVVVAATVSIFVVFIIINAILWCLYRKVTKRKLSTKSPEEGLIYGMTTNQFLQGVNDQETAIVLQSDEEYTEVILKKTLTRSRNRYTGHPDLIVSNNSDKYNSNDNRDNNDNNSNCNNNNRDNSNINNNNSSICMSEEQYTEVTVKPSMSVLNELMYASLVLNDLSIKNSLNNLTNCKYNDNVTKSHNHTVPIQIFEDCPSSSANSANINIAVTSDCDRNYHHDKEELFKEEKEEEEEEEEGDYYKVKVELDNNLWHVSGLSTRGNSFILSSSNSISSLGSSVNNSFTDESVYDTPNILCSDVIDLDDDT